MEDNRPFETETRPLYNYIKTIILSQSKLNLWINNYLHVWNHFVTKIALKMILRFLTFMNYS